MVIYFSVTKRLQKIQKDYKKFVINKKVKKIKNCRKI
jgi:hypothetical protein